MKITLLDGYQKMDEDGNRNHYILFLVDYLKTVAVVDTDTTVVVVVVVVAVDDFVVDFAEDFDNIVLRLVSETMMMRRILKVMTVQ